MVCEKVISQTGPSQKEEGHKREARIPTVEVRLQPGQ